MDVSCNYMKVSLRSAATKLQHGSCYSFIIQTFISVGCHPKGRHSAELNLVTDVDLSLYVCQNYLPYFSAGATEVSQWPIIDVCIGRGENIYNVATCT